VAKKVSVVQKIGSWAFILGIVIALIAGFWQLNVVVTSVLIVLGLIVGFLNVTGHETTHFLLATVALVIVSTFGGDVLASVAVIGKTMQQTLHAIIVFVIPATIVVAIKAVYELASSQ